MAKVWEIDCHLEEAEIMEAVIAQQWGKGRKRMVIALGIVGVLMLVLYGLCPENIAYSLLAVLAALEMCLILAQPGRQAKKTARQVQGRRCRVFISESGYLYTEEGRVWLMGERKARVTETQNVFVVCLSCHQLFILPKRCLGEAACSEVRKVLGDCLEQPAYEWYRRAEA